MHSYLRAIGFSNIKKKKQLDEILGDIQKSFDLQKMSEISDDLVLVEITKEFSDSMGITLVGEYNENDEFEMEYYYPYFKGKGITTREEVSVEKHADKESYAGVCDDIKIGVALIFYLQNVTEYLNEIRLGKFTKQNIETTLSGLSISGKILFSIDKNEAQIRDNREASKIRNHMIAAARQGDEEAIESLTLEDIDTYTMISRRIAQEDIFSLVDSYFMPYGIECDQYSVMGEILDVSLVKNSFTEEEIYTLTLECNELIFDICINKKDLLGEPMIGRRFKGTVWMQGKINFEE